MTATEHRILRRRRWQNHTALGAPAAVAFLAAHLGAAATSTGVPAGGPIMWAGLAGLCAAAAHTCTWVFVDHLDRRRNAR